MTQFLHKVRFSSWDKYLLMSTWGHKSWKDRSNLWFCVSYLCHSCNARVVIPTLTKMYFYTYFPLFFQVATGLIVPRRCGGRVSDSDLRCEYSISGKHTRLLGPCDLLHAINDRIYNCFSRKWRHGVISSSFTWRHISQSSSSICVQMPSAVCISFILTARHANWKLR